MFDNVNNFITFGWFDITCKSENFIPQYTYHNWYVYMAICGNFGFASRGEREGGGGTSKCLKTDFRVPVIISELDKQFSIIFFPYKKLLTSIVNILSQILVYKGT